MPEQHRIRSHNELLRRVLVGLNVFALLATVNWFGFTLLIRAAPHGYKGLLWQELKADLIFAGAVAFLGCATLIAGFITRTRSLALVVSSVLAIACAAAGLLVPCYIAVTWGSRL